MIKMTEPKLYIRGVKLWVRFSLNGEVIKRSLNIEDSKVNRKLATTQIIPQMLLKVHSGEFFNNKIVPTVKEMIDISLKMNRASRKLLTHRSYVGSLNKTVGDNTDDFSANRYKSHNYADVIYTNTSITGLRAGYKTNGDYVLEGSTTIANGGIGGNHPYFSGVTIPSYVGATNPDDNNWADGVLSLANVTTLMNGGSGDPDWIEGGASSLKTPHLSLE